MTLAKKKCIPCHTKMRKFTREEAEEFLEQLPGWDLSEDLHLLRSYKFKDFSQAMKRANKIASIADEQEHHPDITVSWGKLSIELWTHFTKGLTENDFILAAKIEELNNNEPNKERI
ncbi:MAG: 4a-hydroxytetrahydrobiopterin dehydratase [Candidatus Melainabacteria bacterium]|nr:MAG: 4a-hydroxytetrahydrobiopterin dehydratase [Candidatus Melainabacteria bacterium]